MENEICPIIETCTFFNNSFLTPDIVGETYKRKYCLSSPKFKECKRYIVYLGTGKQAPKYIMPNSQLSIDEISWKIEL